MFQSRIRTEPYPVNTAVYEYHLDVYMMAAPQVAVNHDKQPVWDRNQQPNLYTILTCTAEDKIRGKKAKITIKVVDKQNGKKEPVELDILRLHEYQHEPSTKPPILQARSQDLSWQVRWRTTLKPKATEPDLYRRAQMVFLSSTELEDFISKIAPLLNTRRLAATPVPAASLSSSNKPHTPSPAPPTTLSSSALSSSTPASSVHRMHTAFQPSAVQEDAPGSSSSSSSSSGSGSSSSKTKATSKRKELDPVDEEDEDATAPSSETERKREKEKEKAKKKKKKKPRKDGIVSSLCVDVEKSPPPLPSTSPGDSSAAAGGSSRNRDEHPSSSHSNTSPEGSFSPTPSRPRLEDSSTLISSKDSSSSHRPSSSSTRSPGRSSSSSRPPPPPSYPLPLPKQQHHDILYYRQSFLPPPNNPKSSPLRPQPVASTSNRPRSTTAPATNNDLLLSDLAGLDFGNGPSTAEGPSALSSTPKKGGDGGTGGTTDWFSLIDLQSPLVSPLKASNVFLVHPTQTKEVVVAPAAPPPPPASPTNKRGKKRDEVDVDEGAGEVASSSKKARFEGPSREVWELDIAGLGKEDLKELMREVMREDGFDKLVERVEEIAGSSKGGSHS